MSKDMRVLIRLVDSWKWPSTLGSFTGVIYGLWTKDIAPTDATMEVIKLLCAFGMFILFFGVIGIYSFKLTGSNNA